MKFAFSTNAYRNFDFNAAACAISKAGYTGIEIMCDTPHAFPDELSNPDIETIRESLRANALEISNLNAFMMCAVQDFHHPSWIEPDITFRQKRIQYTLDCIDLARQLGVKTISTEPGGPLGNMSRQTAVQIFAQGLEQVLDRAKDNNIKVLIEPEPGLLIQTSDEYLAFLDHFNHPSLGLNFDIGHFYCMGEDPVQTIIKLKEYTDHYHLEDIPKSREHKHILPGEGGIDIPAVLDTIHGTGYQGYVTVELYPYLDDPDFAAAAARTYIKNSCGYV